MLTLLKRYRNIPIEERRLFWTAVWLSYRCKMGLWFKSFKNAINDLKAVDDTGEIEPEILVAIRKAVRRSNHLTFWKNKCLVNTMTARILLNRHNINSEAYLGVRKDEQGELQAHAWIVAHGIEIVRKENAYTELHSF